MNDAVAGSLYIFGLIATLHSLSSMFLALGKLSSAENLFGSLETSLRRRKEFPRVSEQFRTSVVNRQDGTFDVVLDIKPSDGAH